jgi:hypothetical protein
VIALNHEYLLLHYSADNPWWRRNAQNLQNWLYGKPHVVAPLPSRQFVKMAPRVVAKNNFVDFPGIELVRVGMTT